MNNATSASSLASNTSGPAQARAHLRSGVFDTAFGFALPLIAVATLFRGGNRHVPMAGLEWMSLAVCLAWGWGALWSGRWPVGWGQGAARWGFVALAAAIPLWVLLLNALGPFNTTPFAGWSAALVGLPVVAMWLMGLSASPAQTQTLWRAWLWVALAQAAIGLMQLGGWEALRFGLDSGEKLIGTYASKNTYSNLMVMALPLAVHGLLLKGDGNAAHNRVWLWGAALFVLLVAISLSTSRTGIATGLLTVLLSVGLLTHARARADGRAGNEGRQGSRRWVWLGAAVLLVAVALTGGLDWLTRFDGDRLAADDALRGLLREATWQGAMAYWPWGSGLGSYRWVAPAFQPPEFGSRLMDMAHNDYLQLLMELGVGFVLLAGLVLALVARRVWALWLAARPKSRRERGGWNKADRLAVACGLGVLATALHALVDYPLHIPANAMMAAFLLGVFLREPQHAQGEPLERTSMPNNAGAKR